MCVQSTKTIDLRACSGSVTLSPSSSPSLTTVHASWQKRTWKGDRREGSVDNANDHAVRRIRRAMEDEQKRALGWAVAQLVNEAVYWQTTYRLVSQSVMCSIVGISRGLESGGGGVLVRCGSMVLRRRRGGPRKRASRQRWTPIAL